MRVQDAEAADRFHCRWLRTRRLGFARLLGRLSTLFLLAPVVVVYALGALAEALGLRWAGGYETAIPVILTGIVGAVLFGVASALADRGVRARAVEISVEEHDLLIHHGARVRVIPRDRIEGGIVLRELREPILELTLRGEQVLRVGMRSHQQAEAFVELLGLGADRRRVAVTLGGQGGALAAAALAAPLAFLVWGSMWVRIEADRPYQGPLFALLVVASTLLARRALLPRRVVVGADGVHVRGRFRERYLRLGDIGQVASRGRDFVLEPRPEADPRRRGPITVPCSDPGVAAALVDRVRAAIGGGPGRARPASVEALLDQGERPLAAWRIAVGKALRGEGRYRSAPVTAEDLRAVLEDPAAPTRLRVGAAIALRDAGDPDAQARAGRAAQACADEGTRAALEAAAEDDLDARAVRRRLRG
jgi:hypothetical protein